MKPVGERVVDDIDVSAGEELVVALRDVRNAVRFGEGTGSLGGPRRDSCDDLLGVVV